MTQPRSRHTCKRVARAALNTCARLALPSTCFANLPNLPDSIPNRSLACFTDSGKGSHLTPEDPTARPTAPRLRPSAVPTIWSCFRERYAKELCKGVHTATPPVPTIWGRLTAIVKNFTPIEFKPKPKWRDRHGLAVLLPVGTFVAPRLAPI